MPSDRRPDFDEEDEGLPRPRSPRHPVLPYERSRSPVPGVSRRESPSDDRRRPRRVGRHPSLGTEREEPHEHRSPLRSSSPTFVPLEGSQAHRTPPPHLVEHSPTLSYEGDPVIPPRHPSARAPSAIPIQRSDQRTLPSHVRAPAEGDFFRPGESQRAPSRREPGISRPPTVVPIGPTTGRERSPPPSITRYSPPITEADGGTEYQPSRRPTVREHSPPPGVSRYTPPPIIPIEADRPSHPPHVPVTRAPSGRGYAPVPPSAVESQIRRAGDEPIIPHVPSARHPLPEPHGIAPTVPRSEYTYGDQPEGVPVPAPVAPIPTATHRPPHVTEAFAQRPESVVARPLVPSGPGDLAFEDAERARQEAFQEHQQRWTDLARDAEDAEERREQFFREHEEERDRIFGENENRRDHEAQQRRDEIFRSLEDRLAIPSGQPPAISSRPPSAYTVADEGLPEEGTVAPTDRESISELGAPGAPQPTSVAVPPAVIAPQLNEILDLLRAQQSQMADTRAAEEERQRQQENADADRNRLVQEQEERIQALEAELARTREELEQERGTRRMEELERADQQRAENNERDQAFRDQLNDITTLLQQQADQCEDKKAKMEDRWNEKMIRREGKDVKNDRLFDMVKQILDERAEEKREREDLRAQEAERPSKTSIDNLN